MLLVSASAILAVAFSLPIGAERLARTQYQRLEGFVGSFEGGEKAAAAPAATGAPAGGTETWGLVAQAVRQRYTPIEANALLSRVQSLTKTPEAPRKVTERAGQAKARKRAAQAAPAGVAISSAAPKAETNPQAIAPTAIAPETADSVGEAYENDSAKYALDAAAASGPVGLRLRGLSRSSGRYILKLAVTNRGGDDFFVREVSLRDGQDVVGSKSFLRLFVEPGRTREGLVVFEKPRTGAVVHVALKEDREKGRLIELAVPYPF